MRCPKCQYISFDSGGRCRNCGYDFSLATDPDTVELPIQNGTEPIGPLSDFSLNRLEHASAPDGPAPRDVDDAQPAAAAGQQPARAITSSFDLPLFKDRSPSDDAPLVTPGAAPRPPLAVRRTSIAPQKARPRREEVNPRLALDTAEIPIATDRAIPEPVAGGVDEHVPTTAPPGSPAPVLRRLGAALIDALILGGIDVTVLYFTLRICELSWSEAGALPMVPFVAFLLLMNGSYFATFVAAGGQTIGKMATGLRVVSAYEGEPAARVTLGHAIVRAAAYLVSVFPAGLGFLPAFFGDRRALHDRLANTRVVAA